MINSYLRDIDEQTDDVVDREIKRVSRQFGDYERLERW